MGYFSSYENLRELFSALKTSAMSSFAKKDIYGDSIINGQNMAQIILNYNASLIDPKTVSSDNTLIIGQKNEFYLESTGNIYNVIGNNNNIKRSSYEMISGNYTYYAQPNNIYMFGRYNSVEGNVSIAYLYGGSNSINWKNDDYSGYSGYSQEHANLFGYSNSIGGNIQATDRVNLFGAENSFSTTTKVMLANTTSSRPYFSMCSLFGYRNTFNITNTVSGSRSEKVYYANAFGMDNSATWKDYYTWGLNMFGYYNSAANPGDYNCMFGKSNTVENTGGHNSLFGEENYFSSGTNYSFSFGYGNRSYNGASYCSLTGLYNTVYSTSNSTFFGYSNNVRNGTNYHVFGASNRINDSDSEGGANCTAVGYNNNLSNTQDTYVFGSHNNATKTNRGSGYDVIIGKSNTLMQYSDSYMPPSFSFIFGYNNSLQSTYYDAVCGINNYAKNTTYTYQAGQNNSIYGNKITCSGYVQIGFNNYIEDCSNYTQIGSNNKILYPEGNGGTVHIFGNDNTLSESNGCYIFGIGNELTNASGTTLFGYANTIENCNTFPTFGCNNHFENSYSNSFGSYNTFTNSSSAMSYGNYNTHTNSSGTLLFGMSNNATDANGCYVFGVGNNVNNTGCHIFGVGNNANAYGCLLYGSNLEASCRKFVLGTYNEDKQDNLFELGFGGYEAPKNILEIDNDENVIAKDFVNADGIRLSSIKNSNELRMKSIQNIISQQDGVIIYDGYNEEDNTIIEYDEEENVIHISFSNEEHETYCKYGYVIIPESSVSCSEYYIGNLTESESSLTDDISESYFTSFYKSDVDSIRIIVYKVCQKVSMNDFLQLKALVENMI